MADNAVVREIQVKFAADVAKYRQQLANAGQATREVQERIDSVGGSLKRANDLSNREISAMNQALAAASRQAAQMGKAATDLYSKSTQLTRAVTAEQNNLAKLKAAYQSTEKEVDRLKSAYDTIKSATEGLDLSTSLTEQREKAAAEMDKLEQEIQALHNGINSAGGAPAFFLPDNTLVSIGEAKKRMEQLIEETDRANERFQRLDEAIRTIGEENLGYASAKGLKQLQTDLGRSQQELERLAMQTQQSQSRLTDYSEKLAMVRDRQVEVSASTAELSERVEELESVATPDIGQRIAQGFARVAEMVRGSLSRAFQMAGREVSRFAGKLISLAPGTSILKSVVDRLRGVKSGGDGANSALSGMVRQIRNINLAGMALRGVTLLFGRLRSVVQQYLSENAAAKNAVDGLKSAFANALAPAINIAINALSAILPYIQAVSNAFATLVTNLLGAEWTTISGAASDMSGVASATKDAAKAQKELNRELYSFDEINKQSDNSSGDSSGGGGGGGNGASTSTITGNGMPGQFKEFFERLFDPLKRAWDNVGSSVMTSIQTAFETIKQTAIDIGTSFVDVWTDGTGQAWAESMLENFRSLVDLGTAFVGTFDQAWTEAGRGDEVIRSIFEQMTEVNGMLTDIQDAFTNVWNNGTGKKIWGDVLDIITNVNGAVSGLAGQFRKAWNEAGNGEGIWQGILDIVESVLGHVKSMTDATKKWAKNLNLEPLMDSIRNLVEKFKPIADDLGALLERLYNDVILPITKWLAETGIPNTIDSIATLLDTISGYVHDLLVHVGVLEADGSEKERTVFDFADGISKAVDTLFYGKDKAEEIQERRKEHRQERVENGDIPHDILVDWFASGGAKKWWGGVNSAVDNWRNEHLGGFNLGDWLDNFEPYHWDTSTAGASNRIIPGSSTTKPLQGTVRPILPLNMEKNSADALERIKKATLEMRDQMQGKMGVNGDNTKTGVNAIKLNARLTAQGKDDVEKVYGLDGATMNTTVQDKLNEEPVSIFNRIRKTLDGVGVSINDKLSEEPAPMQKRIKTVLDGTSVKLNNTLQNTPASLATGFQRSWKPGTLSHPNVLKTAPATLAKDFISKWKPGNLLFPTATSTTPASFASSTAKKINDELSKARNKIKPKFANVEYKGTSKAGGIIRFVPKFLAKGGIIKRPTWLDYDKIGGEAGAEAIVPLENNTAWLDKLADRLYQRMGGGNSGGIGQPTIVQVLMPDGRVLGETVVDYATGEAKRTGQLPWAAYE